MGANKTPNIGLNNWLGNEFPKRQGFAEDNLKIDEEIQALKDTVGSGLTATNVTIADIENKLNSPNVEGALLEINTKAEANKTSILALQNNDGTLANLQTTNKTNLVSAINEVFQNANNGKNTIATAVGSPLINTDTFSAMGTKIDTLTQTFKDILISKKLEILESDKISSLISKVEQIVPSALPEWYGGHDTWITPANLPVSRYNAVSCIIGEIIYILGGNLATRVDCYDTSKNTYSQKADTVPISNNTTCAVIGTNIYIFSVGSGISETICYDTVTNTSSNKAALPYARNGCASSAVGNSIYLMGGITSSNSLNANQRYDIITNTWTTMANMLYAVRNISSVAVGDKIYVIGGLDGNLSGVAVAYNQCYDTITNTWSFKAVMPTARYGNEINSFDNKIYVTGGVDTGYRNVHECYNILTNTWTRNKDMYKTRTGSMSAIIDNYIYILGGYNGAVLSDNECYVI